MTCSCYSAAFSVGFIAAWAAITTRRTATAITTVTTRPTIITGPAIATTFVTVTLLHHGGLIFFVLFNTNGHKTHYVFVDAHLTFHFSNSLQEGSIDVHQNIMCFAAFVDAVSDGFQTPDIRLCR